MDPATAAAAPPPGAVVVNVEAAATAAVRAAAPARKAPSLRRVRWALALALLVLGFATASLAAFAMSLPLANSGVQGCARTEEEEADLREAADLLLVSASAQVLAATATLLVPALPLAFVALMVGSYTTLSATDVVWMLLACHGRVHGVAAFHYWFFYALVLEMLIVAAIYVIARPSRT